MTLPISAFLDTEQYLMLGSNFSFSIIGIIIPAPICFRHHVNYLFNYGIFNYGAKCLDCSNSLVWAVFLLKCFN